MKVENQKIFDENPRLFSSNIPRPSILIGLIVVIVALSVPVTSHGQDQEFVFRDPDPEKIVSLGYTYQRSDGNRVAKGKGAMSEVAPVDIQLGGIPEWVVGTHYEGGYLWAAVLEEGLVEGYWVSRTAQVEPVSIKPGKIPPNMPPLLAIEDGYPVLFTPPVESASMLTHPVVLSSSDRLAFINGEGELVIWDESHVTVLKVNALPDARILVDERERLLLLTDPTTDYGHGALGDQIEARSITLIETSDDPSVVAEIRMPGKSVVEGIAPIWADLTGDGEREIITTNSDRARGARIFVFKESGELLGSGTAVGKGYRWRHQLALARFNPEGEIELVDVLTPHIGGQIEYYGLNNDNLEIVAARSGFTSHVIGSRNLDMAVVGDVDGNGKLELLIPSDSMIELGAISRTRTGLEESWRVPIGGTITTNIATVTSPTDDLAVAVGGSDKKLRIWVPGTGTQ